MSNAEIGVIGMGVMGSNLALNIAEKGFKVAMWNRNDKRHARGDAQCRRRWPPISPPATRWKN